MRIVAGKHKGRALLAPKGRDTRPTSDRTRGALFNILEHGISGFSLRGCHVLDVFAGTGALGLEALSRGAETATFMEQGRNALTVLGENITALRVESQSTILRTDATRPTATSRTCDLVFLDPPYGKRLIPKALKALSNKGWIAPGAVIVAETASKETDPLPDGFTQLDERIYGAAKILFAICDISETEKT